ncbi:MAG: hypothetical protein WD928_13635 [Gammaproteobacteria bacterium]
MVAISSDDIEQMRKAPAAVFASPREIIEDDRLNTAQKRQILESWAHDCREQAVADDEGMPPTQGRTGALLREVEEALGTLDEEN